jgi:hypothetical protein
MDANGLHRVPARADSDVSETRSFVDRVETGAIPDRIGRHT